MAALTNLKNLVDTVRCCLIAERGVVHPSLFSRAYKIKKKAKDTSFMTFAVWLSCGLHLVSVLNLSHWQMYSFYAGSSLHSCLYIHSEGNIRSPVVNRRNGTVFTSQCQRFRFVQWKQIRCLLLLFQKIMSRNYMSKNDELRKGDYLLSNNQKYKAIFQVIITGFKIYIYLLRCIHHLPPCEEVKDK